MEIEGRACKEGRLCEVSRVAMPGMVLKTGESGENGCIVEYYRWSRGTQ